MLLQVSLKSHPPNPFTFSILNLWVKKKPTKKFLKYKKKEEVRKEKEANKKNHDQIEVGKKANNEIKC